jgi:hypothetical protein
MGHMLLIKMHLNWGKIGQRMKSPLGLWTYLCKEGSLNIYLECSSFLFYLREQQSL